MSNLVIWTLLSPLILRCVDRIIRDPVESMSLESEREKHPLVNYLEQRFNEVFKPDGGLSCPELEERLRDMKERYPEKLEKLVETFVKEYYQYLKYRKRKPALSREYYSATFSGESISL